jgi:hypothetical protein
MAGIYEIISNFILENNTICSVTAPEYLNFITEKKKLIDNLFSVISVTSSAMPCYGPHLFPKSLFLGNPLRIYTPKLNRNLIGVENHKRTIIYQ